VSFASTIITLEKVRQSESCGTRTCAEVGEGWRGFGGDARSEIAGFERLQRALHLRPERPAHVRLLLTVSR
jgi:hypothetical protein